MAEYRSVTKKFYFYGFMDYVYTYTVYNYYGHHQVLQIICIQLLTCNVTFDLYTIYFYIVP
jgi:hypothetical protein